MTTLSREVIEKAFAEPVAYRPTGWPKAEPDALREPSKDEVKARLLAAMDGAASGSPEESARFPGPDGTMMVSVLVARSLPFARALLHEWSLLDGKDRGYLLKAKSISLPASVFDGLLPKVRDRLRPGGLDE